MRIPQLKKSVTSLTNVSIELRCLLMKLFRPSSTSRFDFLYFQRLHRYKSREGISGESVKEITSTYPFLLKIYIELIVHTKLCQISINLEPGLASHVELYIILSLQIFLELFRIQYEIKIDFHCGFVSEW